MPREMRSCLKHHRIGIKAQESPRTRRSKRTAFGKELSADLDTAATQDGPSPSGDNIPSSRGDNPFLAERAHSARSYSVIDHRLTDALSTDPVVASSGPHEFRRRSRTAKRACRIPRHFGRRLFSGLTFRLQPRRPMIAPGAVGCKPKLAGPSNAAPAQLNAPAGHLVRTSKRAARLGTTPDPAGAPTRATGLADRRGRAPRRRACLAGGAKRQHCHARPPTFAGATGNARLPRIAHRTKHPDLRSRPDAPRTPNRQ
jgi:hypothetical protein